MNDKRARSLPWSLYAFVACLAFAVPMLLVQEHPRRALAGWLITVVVYLGLLGLFGKRFVLEGALFGFILASAMAAVLNVLSSVALP